MHPAPVTNAISPILAFPCIAACIPTDKGSIKAPSIVDNLSGSLNDRFSG